MTDAVLFSQSELAAIEAATIDGGIADPVLRRELMDRLPNRLWLAFKGHDDAISQLRGDLTALNQLFEARGVDGPPLAIWLQNAAQMLDSRGLCGGVQFLSWAEQARTRLDIASTPSQDLISFCRLQVESRMKRLRAEDPRRGAKYCPRLYLPRTRAERELDELLRNDRKPCVLLVGKPQVGKTNLLCHLAESRLAQSLPTLFFTGIGISSGGLLKALGEDYRWNFGGPSDPVRVARHLNQGSGPSEQTLVLIDAWNEAEQQTRRLLADEVSRLLQAGFRAIISLTTTAAEYVLTDSGGNLNAIAVETQVTPTDLRYLEKGTKRKKCEASIVLLEDYDEDETSAAVALYSREFDVNWHSCPQFASNPFLLRVAMEHHEGSQLPDQINSSDLISRSLRSKLRRAINMDHATAITLAASLAGAMFRRGAPISLEVAARACATPAMSASNCFQALVDAGVLVRADSSDVPQYDFYFHRERDFVVAYWSRSWSELTLDSANDEIAAALSTNVGRSALDWFFLQDESEPTLRQLANHFNDYPSAPTRAFLGRQVARRQACYPSDAPVPGWIEEVLGRALRDGDPDVGLETIIAAGPHALRYLDEDTLEAFLLVDESHPLVPADYEDSLFWSLRELAENELCMANSFFDFGDLLERFGRIASAHSPASPRAVVLMARLSGFAFLTWIQRERDATQFRYIEATTLDEAMGLALGDISEAYFGSICPGWLDGATLNEAREHAEVLLGAARSFLRQVPNSSLHIELDRLLRILADEGRFDVDGYGYTEDRSRSEPDLRQLLLDLPTSRD